MKISVNDVMQKGYSYERTEPIGKNFREDFNPELTPKEMLSLGIMGGKYFNDVANGNEFPKDWFRGAKLCGIKNSYDKDLNYYGVKCGQSLKEWKESDWLDKEDPRGWIQWYFRYYLGRRIPEIDDRQIKRWKNAERFVKSAITRHKKTKEWSLALLQSAMHWSYDTRKQLKKDK